MFGPQKNIAASYEWRNTIADVQSKFDLIDKLTVTKNE